MQALIIGQSSATAFTEVVSSLRALIPQSGLSERTSLRDTESTSPADLVLILQSWPDEFTQSEMLGLMNHQPLARLIVAYGPWCDSDGRTRDIWPHASRVPLAEAPDRLRQELEDIPRQHQSLPWTANRNETFEQTLLSNDRSAMSSLLVSVLSPDPAICDWIRDVLEDAGHTVCCSIEQSSDLIVWDADPWSAGGRERLAQLLPQCAGIPIVAMIGFPRTHEVRELLSVGVDHVLSKGASNESLITHLEAASRRRHTPESTTASGVRVHRTG